MLPSIEVDELENHAEGVALAGRHLDIGWVWGFGKGAGAFEDGLWAGKCDDIRTN